MSGARPAYDPMTRAQQPRPLVRPAAVSAAACAVLLSTAARAAEEGLQLMPDLPFASVAKSIGAPYGYELVGLIALFVLLVAPANRLVFQPLFRVLDAREERIGGTRARARRLEEQAEAVLGRYEAALGETRAEAERERRSRLEQARAESQRASAEARGEAEGRIAQARVEVAASLEEARAALRSEAEGLARQVASQVLGRAL